MSENQVNQKYEILEGDNDVLLLNNKDTFTVQRFKELVGNKFNDIVGVYIQSKMTDVMNLMSSLSISEETKTMIPGGDINWNSAQKGIDCQVLKVGSKGWEKGKIKIEVSKSFQSGQTQACIKFSPDEPPEQKSPLDDIRQSEEYKKLSNNN